MKEIIVAISVILTSSPVTLLANELALVPLKGSSYGEVLEMLGIPKEKEIREIKREDLWIYDKQSVLFREGKVVEVKSPEILVVPVKSKPKKTTPKSNDEVDRILKDIVSGK